MSKAIMAPSRSPRMAALEELIPLKVAVVQSMRAFTGDPTT